MSDQPYKAPRFTEKEADAVAQAIDCEIVTRNAAARDEFGNRCDVPRGQGAIDDIVPALERALRKLRNA